jgi:AsmA protein
MRWIGRVLLALVVAGAIFLAGLFLVPSSGLARFLEARIEAVTGRDVTIEGEVRPSLWPRIGFRTGRVLIANADWGEGAPMLEADGLVVGVELLPLMRGDIEIGEITAVHPRLLVETGPDGAINWDVFSRVDSPPAARPSEPPETGTARPTRRISLQRLSLTDAAIRFIDRKGGGDIAFTDIDIEVQAPDFSDATHFDIRWRRGGEPIRLVGELGRTQAFLDGAPSPFSAAIEAAGSRLTLEGDARLEGAAEGRVRADIADTGRFLAAFGLAGVDLPAGLGRRGWLEARFDLSPEGALRLDDIVADLEGTRLSGNLAAAFAGKPRITGQVNASRLVLPPVGGSGGSGAGGARADVTAAEGWPTTPIDASPLALVDADIVFTATEVVAEPVRLSDLALRLTIDNARAVADVTRARGFGGQLSGRFVANARRGFSVRATASATEVDMYEMLRVFAGFDRLAGTGQAEIDVLGVGISVDAIMRSLEGSAALSVRDGEIFGLALARLFLNEGVRGGSTIFDSLAATFDIAGGVARNDDLFIDMPALGATGAGQIDLGNRTIDYRVTPRLPKESVGREVVFPVIIRGPWSAPQIRPDLEAAIRQTFEREIDAGRERLREEVTKKLEEVIGGANGGSAAGSPQAAPEQEAPAAPRTPQDILREELERGGRNLLNDLLRGR